MLNNKHLLTLADYSSDEIAEILNLAHELKAKQKAGIEHHILKGKTLGMIFEKNSTRTRVSFEVGMYQLGGQALFLSNRDLQLSRGEPIKDTARVLSRYLDGIMIRTFAQKNVEELANYGSIPIINGLTDDFHPCQALTDMLTLQEHLGKDLQGLKFVYLGDGNNMAHSLINACVKLGINVAVACPPDYMPKEEVVALAKLEAAKHNCTVEILTDPEAAAKDADVLCTDVWASMGQEEEHAIRCKIFAPYQLNSHILSLANKRAKVLHCLPAHRGEEITEEVFEQFSNIIFDEAENRLHTQKAIMALLMNK